MRSRGRKAHKAANHERWLISYADFLTLLFATFVMMFAVSQGPKAAAGETKAAGVPPNIAGSGVPPGLKEVQGRLSMALKDELLTGKVEFRSDWRGLAIALRERAFFDSGGTDLIVQARSAVERIAEILKDVPNPIQVEGHTDSIPIHTARFEDNWRLSAERACVVMEVLTANHRMDPKRLSVAGYGANVPVESNDTLEGRAANRRVEIIIIADVPSVDKGPQAPQPATTPEAARRPASGGSQTAAPAAGGAAPKVR